MPTNFLPEIPEIAPTESPDRTLTLSIVAAIRLDWQSLTKVEQTEMISIAAIFAFIALILIFHPAP